MVEGLVCREEGGPLLEIPLAANHLFGAGAHAEENRVGMKNLPVFVHA